MSKAKLGTAATVALIGVLTAGPSYAQSDNDAEIALLKQQLKLMEKKIDKLQKQASSNTAAAASARAKAEKTAGIVNANAAVAYKRPVASSGVIVKMPNNRPTICTADNQNCIAITSRLHFDAGGYDYRPNTALTAPQTAQNGVNARRARIGILGTFAGDWDYGLIYDFGGSQDGAATLENAYVAYKGFKNVYIQGGYIDVPYTLDEVTGSNNGMFMERASAQVIAVNLAAGDNRSAFGLNTYGDWWWVGSYVTGPTSGTVHSNRPQYGATARGVVLPFNNAVGTLLVGADAEFLFDTGGAAGLNNLTTFNDRIELRIDPGTNALLNTGALADVRGAQVFSGEAATQFGSFYAQGEYFDYSVNRMSGLPDLHFNGGYVQASYVVTGEQRKYSNSTGAFGGINPKNPASWSGGWGAWEIAARYSQTTLNDQTIFGGEEKSGTLGINWYVNQNVRFLFNWVHGQVDKRNVAGADTGAHYDAFGMRTQVAF